MVESRPYPYITFLTKSVAEVFGELQTGILGLDSAEALRRLVSAGENRIPRARVHGLKVFARQFSSPFTYLLIFAALVAFFLGERIDALTILIIVSVNGLLGFAQEYRAERALEKLEQMLIPRVSARRDGAMQTVNVHELVLGDLIPLAAGDIIPADIRMIEAQGLTIDESILTGESVQVVKKIEPLAATTEEFTRAENIAFSGTKVVSGRGAGVIVATGAGMVLGHIATRLHQIERKSGYEAHLRKFSGLMMKVVLTTIVVLFGADILLKGRGVNIPELFLFVLALAISVVPEALPVVTTLTLSSGAARLAKEHAVVRRLSALEDLGNIDVLCTDKTGTITENKMRVVAAVTENSRALLAAAGVEIFWIAEHAAGGINGLGSFDKAIFEYGKVRSLPPAPLPEGEGGRRPGEGNSVTLGKVQARVVGDLPFDPRFRFSAVVAEVEKGQQLLIVRGAPEELVLRATLTESERKKIITELAEAGKRGYRALGVGQRVWDPEEKVSVSAVRDLTFLGYFTFEDPLKSTSNEALKEARALGVDVRIITGDSAQVAFAVGREIGLVQEEAQVQTGAVLRALMPGELDAVIERTKIFARVSPEEKFLIIQSLQKNHSVGFLGEGVNDAPALELANVALVVDSASPVAREAADVILTKRDLRVIVHAISDGRKTFENVAKYLKYTLIGNFGNFYAIAGISLILPFVPLLPVQILLTNLLTDFPLIAVAFDRVAQGELRRPRSFSLRPLIMFCVFLGLVSSLFDFLFFGIFRNSPPAELRTLWFMLSILTELALIFSIRTRGFFLRGPAPALSLGLLSLGAAAVTVALPFIPSAQAVFHFARPAFAVMRTIFLLAFAYLITTESVKHMLYRFSGNVANVDNRKMV